MAGVKARLRRVLQAVRGAFGRAPAEPEPDVYEAPDADLEDPDEPLSFVVNDLYTSLRSWGVTPTEAVREVGNLCDLPDAEVRRLIDDERARADRA